MSRLVVVCVAYGAAELLDQALEALVGALPLLVVDNSSDPAVRAVASAHAALYDDPGTNLGFAGGVNRGVAAAWRDRGPCDILLLNPDAVITAEAAAALHQVLRSEPRLAAVSPALTDTSGRSQRVEWPFPTPRGRWLQAVGLGRRNDRRRDWLVGALLLLRAEALQDVGDFDERFFLYQEETDWQLRATRRGWGMRSVPSVTARHVGAGTSSDSSRRSALFHAGAETYVRKWFGARGWASYRVAALVDAALRSALPGPRGQDARRRLALYARGPRRAAGLA